MGRGTMHQAAQVADPDETLACPEEGQTVCVPELPVEEQGFTHRRVEAETVGGAAAAGTIPRTCDGACEASHVEKSRNLPSCQMCW